MIHRFLLALVLSASIGGCALADAYDGKPQKTLPQSGLVIDTPKGAQRFVVEVADSWGEQETGLMFRTRVAPGEGMLFDFGLGREEPHSFWMKNTLIPLDMVFIRKDGRIARIAANTVPRSLASVASGEPVLAVLELAGGRAAELGIKRGDIVRHKIFGNMR